MSGSIGCRSPRRPGRPSLCRLYFRNMFGVLMSANTGIEWTDSTWNPTTGCTRLTRGCDHCYAATLATRLLADAYLAQPPVKDLAANRRDPFAVRVWENRLEQPSRWSEPRRVFVNSMSDLFHVDVPELFLLRVFEVMVREDRHIYQVLTKRPSRAQRFLEKHPQLLRGGKLPRHIWIGTSVEDQAVAFRVNHLREVPARVRFLSCEPLLGPLRIGMRGISWVIVGGESGPGFRPMDLEWARGLRDQCGRAGVPFFFKQVGGYTPKAGGRRLDGRLWSEYPT